MLEQANVRVLQAFSALEGNPDFEEICAWLGKSLVTIRTDTDTQRDEVLTRWQQGGSQVIAEILKKKEAARATLRKL